MGVFPRAPGRVGGRAVDPHEGPHFLVSGNSGKLDGSDGRLHGDGGLHGLHGVLNRSAAAAAERSAFLDGGAAVGTE